MIEASDHLKQADAAVWRQLEGSSPLRLFQSAFAVATGLPLAVLPAGTPGSCDHQGAYSALARIEGCLGKGSEVSCQQTLIQADAKAASQRGPVHFECPAGLLKILVPVIARGRHVGNLLAGPFSLASLNEKKMRGLANRLRGFHLEPQKSRLKVSWRYSPRLTTKKLKAVTILTFTFAQYLSEAANQLVLGDAQGSPLLREIEAFSADFTSKEASVSAVAERLRLSPCRFCQLFKKQTGLTFTEYRTLKKVERAKGMLLGSSLRISEVAFQSGFETVPYFNRAFRRYVGCAPSEYRSKNSALNEDKRRAIQG